MHRLRAVIPAARLMPYEVASAGSDVDAVVLYRWASALALALFDDLATLEVAMRSAMARELASTYGLEWYRRSDIFDDETMALIRNGWRVGRLARVAGTPDVAQGKLVATLMLGFWVKLLGRGAYHGVGVDRRRCIYDTVLWKPALRGAFPNAGDLDRSRVEAAARRVLALRNRIAHHEDIIWGVPLPGERDATGAIRRVPLRVVHHTLIELAGFIDTGLEGWFRDHSQVEARLSECPLSEVGRLNL